MLSIKKLLSIRDYPHAVVKTIEAMGDNCNLSKAAVYETLNNAFKEDPYLGKKAIISGDSPLLCAFRHKNKFAIEWLFDTDIPQLPEKKKEIDLAIDYSREINGEKYSALRYAVSYAVPNNINDQHRKWFNLLLKNKATPDYYVIATAAQNHNHYFINLLIEYYRPKHMDLLPELFYDQIILNTIDAVDYSFETLKYVIALGKKYYEHYNRTNSFNAILDRVLLKVISNRKQNYQLKDAEILDLFIDAGAMNGGFWQLSICDSDYIQHIAIELEHIKTINQCISTHDQVRKKMVEQAMKGQKKTALACLLSKAPYASYGLQLATEKEQINFSEINLILSICPIDYVKIFLRSNYQIKQSALTYLSNFIEAVDFITSNSEDKLFTLLAIDTPKQDQNNLIELLNNIKFSKPSQKICLENVIKKLSNSSANKQDAPEEEKQNNLPQPPAYSSPAQIAISDGALLHSHSFFSLDKEPLENDIEYYLNLFSLNNANKMPIKLKQLAISEMENFIDQHPLHHNTKKIINLLDRLKQGLPPQPIVHWAI